MAERILMNEYKSLSQEDWVNIDVRSIHHPGTSAILLYCYTAILLYCCTTNTNPVSFKMKTFSIGKSVSSFSIPNPCTTAVTSRLL